MEQCVEVLQVLIPSIISIIGFAVTIYINRNSLRTELRKQHLERYMDNYKNIEYDAAEILQLGIRDYLGNDIYCQIDYIIQNHREGEFKETSSVEERLYRLGGYISTYGSKESVRCLNAIRSTYDRHFSKNMNGSEENFVEFVVLLAILLLQIKKDIFKENSGKYDEMDWLSTRLPISLLKKYWFQLDVFLDANKKYS